MGAPERKEPQTAPRSQSDYSINNTGPQVPPLPSAETALHDLPSRPVQSHTHDRVTLHEEVHGVCGKFVFFVKILIGNIPTAEGVGLRCWLRGHHGCPPRPPGPFTQPEGAARRRSAVASLEEALQSCAWPPTCVCGFSLPAPSPDGCVGLSHRSIPPALIPTYTTAPLRPDRLQHLATKKKKICFQSPEPCFHTASLPTVVTPRLPAVVHVTKAQQAHLLDA